jgi:hypothetical protein
MPSSSARRAAARGLVAGTVVGGGADVAGAVVVVAGPDVAGAVVGGAVVGSAVVGGGVAGAALVGGHELVGGAELVGAALAAGLAAPSREEHAVAVSSRAAVAKAAAAWAARRRFGVGHAVEVTVEVMGAIKVMAHRDVVGPVADPAQLPVMPWDERADRPHPKTTERQRAPGVTMPVS